MSTIEQKGGVESVSLFLRLPSDGQPIAEVAEAHNQVIKEHGSVWLGIVGKTYSPENVRLISQNGEFFYFVQNTAAGTCVYKGKIVDFSKTVPASQRSLIPAYYHDSGISTRASLWVKLSTLKRIVVAEIEKLRVVRSGKSASTLLSGMAYFGMVAMK
jgi:hypothetical protein